MTDLRSNPLLDTPLTRGDRKRFDEIAHSWNTLQNHLNGMDEADLAKLFKWENEGQRRIHLLNRIKSRHNRVRDQREREEIFGA